MPPATLTDLLVLFALSVAVVVAFQRWRLPSMVGFLITGVVSGPYGFGLIRNVAEVEGLAEIGVILLLFTVGLEFSLQQLGRLRTFLLVGGGLQVALTIVATAVLAHVIGLAWPVAVFLGMLVALSSTAIVMRLLTDEGDVDSQHGRAALGILIFQDLCVVPMVLLTPMLSGHGGDLRAVGVRLVTAVAFVAGAVIAARFVVPRVLDVVAGTRKREIFLLTIVLLCLGAAWASAAVGLSLALGAFIAGLVIADSEYSHQALGEVTPLREVFNSLFFISIGMLFDVRTVLASPVLVFGAIAGVIALKAAATTGACLAVGQSTRAAATVGLTLTQIGEFSFVLSTVGVSAGVLSTRLDQLFLAVAVGTMVLTPGLVGIARRLAAAVEGHAPQRWARRRFGLAEHAPEIPITDHVIIVGFGFNGRNLARVLREVEIPYRVIDMNPLVVRREQRAGEPIIYGDATSRELLHHAGIERARVLVVAISDAAATRAIVSTARRLNPTAYVIVRARYIQEMRTLAALGTSEVIPEEFETAIEIFTRVLRRYLVPHDVIEHEIREVRREYDEMLRPLPDVGARVEEVSRFLSDVTLLVLRVARDSAVADVSLESARLRDRSGANVLAIQRSGGGLVVNPSGSDTLHDGDTALLLGTQEQLTRAAALFAAPAGEAAT